MDVVGDLYSVEKDFIADDENSLTLKRGTLVEVINFGPCSEKRTKLGWDGEATNILDNAAAKHKLSVKPRRKYADPRQRGVSPFSQEVRWLVRTVEGTSQQGWVPSNILKSTTDSPWASQTITDHESRREGIVKELVETEEEFVRDLQHVVDQYIKYVEKPSIPRIVKDNVDVIFSNFRQIANFHQAVLLEGVKYYASEPRLLGKTFLRLERDFDKHVAYCRDEVAAQEFLAENSEARDFFEELSQNLGEDKSLSEHLKLPIQRINDYQLLLKELVKYSDLLGENTKDLEKALELMLAIPHRANDNKFLSNIEGFHGNIHKLGRLIRHDWFTVTSKDSKSKERYLFLFKGHILVCKVKRISEDRSVFVLKDIIQLPEVKLVDNPELESFEVREENPERCSTICGHKEGVKESWLKEIRKYAPYVFEVDKKADEDNEELRFYDVKEDFECDPISSSAENLPQKESAVTSVEPDDELNKTVIDKEETNKEVYFEARETLEAEEKEKASTTDIVDKTEDKMSRRTLTRTVEESYSVSSQREEVYMQSSRNQYSSSAYSSATAISAEKSYRSSDVTGSSTNQLAIQAVGKPNFTRTITGLSLEPGETAVFECQLDTEAQVTWLKDNKALEDKLADRVVKSSLADNRHRLELQSLIEYDSGIYTALAQNKEGSSTCTAQLQVQKISDEERKKRAEANAPIFTVRLKDTELLRNTNFRFMVKVKGNPNPQVKFLKDGVPVGRAGGRVVLVDEKADIGFYELVISDVQNEDSGQYSCVATNKFGEAHCEGTVTVTDEKKVFEGLEASSLLEPGEKPTFSWLKDGKPFDPEERFKVLLGNEEDSLALVFQHVRPEDAGLYTCVASTTTGRISCSAELSVQGTVSQLAREPEKPRFTTEITENEVNVGGTAMLETKIVGFPKPDVKWFHDGTEIKPTGRFKFLFEDEDTMTLVIKNVTPEDAGSYKVVASNDLGEDSTEIHLSVKAGPKFKKNMEDITAKAEETITITAEVEGTPTPKVKWYKDGNEILASSRIKTEIKTEGSYTLVIENVEQSDAGSYSVIASNEVNQSSQFFKMDVRVPPRITQGLEKSLEVLEGEKIILKVVASADPPPKVLWFKDGKEIKADGKKIKTSQEGDTYILEIADANREDSAKYSVEIRNDHGTKSSECHAKVKCSPVFKESLKDLKVKEGDTDVEFSVRVNAFPKPNIKWYLGETEITEKRAEYTRKEDGENYKLIIKQVATELKGKYTCKVVNDIGSAESSADLIVNYKPKFGKALKPKIQVDEGAELTLEIECSGSPEPEIKWFKDGQEIHADAHIKITRDTHRSESYSMTLNLVKADDAGEYEVTASNLLGSASSKTKVEVTTKNTLFVEETEVTVQVERPQEERQASVIEGEEDSHTIFEKVKTTVEFTENEWTGVRIEEIECFRVEERSNSGHSFGLVEEYSESEVKANKLFVNRGLSIVSLSDDERSLSRNNSLNEMDEIDSNDEANCGDEGPGPQKGSETEAPEGKKAVETSAEIPKFGQMNEGQSEEPEVKQNRMPAESEPANDECDGEDADMNNLLQRIKQQRSVLEDILNKENEYNKEEAPEIISHNLEDRKVTESTSTCYQVKVAGVPRPTIKWFRDGKEITSSDKVKISEDGDTYKLELLDLQTTDSGSYSFKVTNELGEKSKEAKLNVESDASKKKPNIKSPLSDHKASKKEETTFKCILTAESEPEITWFLNEKLIDKADKSLVAKVDTKKLDKDLVECTCTLKIPETTQSHSGKYKIKAENKYGYDECSAELTLVLKPEIENLKDVTGIPQEEAEFEAIVHYSTDVIWLDKSGKTITTGNRITVTEEKNSKTYKLKISDLKNEDSGEYTLVAKNDVGEAKQKVRLVVQAEATTIVKPLEDMKANDYSDVDFHVRFNGFPKPQVKWLKDGVELSSNDRIVIKTLDEGQVSSMLNIKHFNKDDVGEYTVIGSNVAGEAESKCNLKMNQLPPVIGKGFPRSEEVSEGEPLELKCKIDGSPVPKVKWLKNGEPLKADDRIQLSTQPDGTVRMFIENAKPSDSGAYELVAENPNGKATGICAVSVKPKPHKPTIEKGLESVKGVEGEPVKLMAKVVGYPPPDVKWFKDGHPLRPTQGIAVIDEPDGTVGLAFDSLKPEDIGKYTMKVSNKAGQVEDEAKVEVQPKEKKPMFEAHLMSTSTIEGFPAKLQVKAVGHPKPLIKWTHNGVEVVPDGQRIKVVEMPDGMTCLLLDKATMDDGGEYAAVASNDKGEVASKAELKVSGRELADAPQEKPSFLCPLKDVSVNEGTPLSLSATFVGNPLPDAIWTKDGIPLKLDDRTFATCDGRKVMLEIQPSAVGDSGVYGCQLVNPLGEDTCKANGTVKKVFEPPSFVKKLTDLQQLPNCDAKFIARVSGTPKPEVEWFFNEKPIKEGEKYHMKTDGDSVCLYVRNCSPEDAGRYRCRAYNRDGEASSEAKLEVVSEIDKQPKAEAPAFLKKIGDCEVYKGMTAKFTACATGYPEPEFEWFRDSIKLYENRRVKIDDEGNGLLRLTITNIDVGDVGKYRLRIFNPHGEAFCEAELRFESLEPRSKKGMADQYDHYKKIQDTGVPVPLADKPIISRMTDYHLTLSWKPSIPHGPREPVTYRVEMAEQPDGDWFTVRTGVRSCACEVRNLVPFRDYKFRIRVENKYGVSDPSPFAVTHRERLQPDLPKFVPHLGPGVDFRPDSSPYFPKDFDLERPPHDGYKQAPKFLRQEHEVQYGIKNENSNLFWFVYGYPKPTMRYYFNDEPIEMGGRYDCSYTRNGQATLFINKMLERDVGVYEAVAVNEHGEARQRVRMELAEYPRFIQRPEQTIIMLRDSGRLTARVVGVPYPEIKWYKDWQPLAPSSRISFQHIQPDTAILHLNDVILKDEGLYSVSARNIAGSVSTSVMVFIEENAQDYSYLTYNRGRNVKPRNKLISDLYDLGDELGRGTQGVTYHAVERQTGDNFAAKIMHGRADLKAFMLNELDIMNYLNHKKLIRLHDAFEASDLLIIVMELAGGGELLDNLTRRTHFTETDIAGYIRQVLWGLEYMHTQGIAHLSLTLGDLLISHPDGDDLKICDFGLSRKMLYGKPTALHYGMPEYVSPEIVNGDAVGYPADMWAVGIITYILLSGYSPFKGLNDRETLTLIKEGKWEFKEEWFSSISSDAKDFITKLLVYEPLKRMTVKTALNHPWLNFADRSADSQYKIKTDNLKNYYSSWKEWYKNANCRTWYRRKPLSGAFTHPSKMVYPPGETYTPEPEPTPKKEPRSPRTWEEKTPSREPLGYEIGTVKSESHYQNGPDTYLLQLRDVDLPCRLRHYLKVAANREVGPFDAVDTHIDWRLPVIRERRRFTDIMDEEIDDERRERINKYGSADVYSIRRLKREIGLRSDGHAEAEAMLEYQRDGQLPIFREKPQLLAIIEDQPAELSCFAVGDPKPTVQWFKNDIVIAESNRIKMTEDEDGRSYLKFEPALQLDVGIYKVVARNRVGQTIARSRVVVAGVPSSPNSPEATEISDTEILLKWKQPRDDGLSPVLCYSLQYKEAANVEWLNIASNIDHEFWLVKDLKPDTGYVFRLSARNVIGWSEKGIPTKTVRTKEPGSPKIIISNAMKQMQSHVESGAEVGPEEPAEKLNYSIENKPIEWSTDSNLNDKYSFVSEITRGQFSVIAKGIEKSSDRQIVAKVLEVNAETEEAVTKEYENFRSLRHERIVTLLAALRPAPNLAIFVMEKLQGADILTYFSCRQEYNEQMVASVIIQILDGLQYLHWRGLCHLDIEPDNVVLSKSARSLQVKLIDFGSAQKVSKLGTIVNAAITDYTAPEVVCNEAAFPQTDIWSVGVLTYVLLSGVSPFRGENQEETRQNITFVRYRFEYLYKELTQEATRFLMLIFKRTPSKRPTVDECYEHRWLLPTEFMIKKRERAAFLGNRLKEYCDAYHKEKVEKASGSEGLKKAFGDRILTRSNSIVDELSAA